MDRIIPFVAVFVLFAGCTKHPADVPVQKPHREQSPIVGEFKTKIYPVTEHEHVTMYDMPGYWEPTRCWVWVDDVTRTSHMRCENVSNDPAPEEYPQEEYPQYN